jgi:medium-chain acyl-[acyl-carrier-protein] hydrolase
MRETRMDPYQSPGPSLGGSQRIRSPWLSCPRPCPDAPTRLFCLPYAGGGGAVFRQWPARLQGVAEVCPVLLPGREARFKEPAYTRMELLVAALHEAIAPFLDKPFALFGHSMGALIAFELARLLQSRRGLSPVRLFISGSRSPASSFADANVHSLPDEEFLECLHHRYHAIPDAIRENRELAEIVLPSLRADFELLETYRYTGGEKLKCPLTVYAGRDDDTVSLEEAPAWARYSEATAAFRCRVLSGRHFFLRTAEADLLSDLRGELAAMGSRTPSITAAGHSHL